MAVKYKSSGAVEALLAGNAHVNKRKFYGDTPLCTTAKNPKPDMFMLKFLLAKTADLNAYNNIPLHFPEKREDKKWLWEKRIKLDIRDNEGDLSRRVWMLGSRRDHRRGRDGWYLDSYEMLVGMCDRG